MIEHALNFNSQSNSSFDLFSFSWPLHVLLLKSDLQSSNVASLTQLGRMGYLLRMHHMHQTSPNDISYIDRFDFAEAIIKCITDSKLNPSGKEI